MNSKLTKNPLVSFLVTIGSLYLLRGYIAARAQLVTFILFILLLYNIEKFIENKKVKNAVALFVIQTLIANLHVAVWPFTFVLYLPYIAEYIICEWIEITLYHKIKIANLKRKIKSLKVKIEKETDNQKLQEKLAKYQKSLEDLNIRVEKTKTRREENLKNPYKLKLNKNKNVRWLILVMIITIFTGLLTPLGTTPYTYTYLTLQGNTTSNINEHLPLTLIENVQMMCVLILFIGILTFTNVKIRLSDLFMLGGLTYLMFASRRQQSMFVLICSVILVRLITQLIETNTEIKVEDIIDKYFNKFVGFVIIAIVILFSLHFFKEKKDDVYIDESTYPVEASEWILENLDLDEIKLYNEYNYGSYLLYKGIPVFIDSRADLYTPEFNSYTGYTLDGVDVFSDFLNSSNIGVYYGEIFEEYGITHVIVYKSSKINMLIENADSEKYELLYSDDYFVIYEVLEY